MCFPSFSKHTKSRHLLIEKEKEAGMHNLKNQETNVCRHIQTCFFFGKLILYCNKINEVQSLNNNVFSALMTFQRRFLWLPLRVHSCIQTQRRLRQLSLPTRYYFALPSLSGFYLSCKTCIQRNVKNEIVKNYIDKQTDRCMPCYGQCIRKERG